MALAMRLSILLLLSPLASGSRESFGLKSRYALSLDAEEDEEAPNGRAPVLNDQERQESEDWLMGMTAEDYEQLKAIIGPEVYDAECTSHIVEVLTRRVPQSNKMMHKWWVSEGGTLEKDPLVKGMVDKKNRDERDKEFDDMFNAQPKFGSNPIAWLANQVKNLWRGMSNRWKNVRDDWKLSDKEVTGFHKDLARIREGIREEDGTLASICSWDMATLKLLPFSRGWHDDLYEHGGKEKCTVSDQTADRAIGLLDADRVIRSTQMAIYQACHYKCVRFVADNFKKTTMSTAAHGDDFCEMSYSKQRQTLGHLDSFLEKLINDKESDMFYECQALFAQDGTGAELVDFAIEQECTKYRRPTPFYNPSENAPLYLYNRDTPNNKPVCVPEKNNKYATYREGRQCPEGTHCHCQRNANMNHTLARTKPGVMSIQKWFSMEHSTSIRRSGAGTLLWVDASKEVQSKWAKNMRKFSLANHGDKIGLALVVGGGAYAVAASGVFAGASTVGSGISFSGIVAGATAVGTAIGTGVSTAAAVATAGIGPGIILGVVGLSMYAYSKSFDCKDCIGCYPLECKYDFDLKLCHMDKYGLHANASDPEAVSAGNPLWWMPPPGLQCAYLDKKWYNFGKGAHKCGLRSCNEEQLSKNMVGFWQSPNSNSKTQKKLDLMNCQPLNVKDMSSHQKSELLKGLRNSDESREVTLETVDSEPKTTMRANGALSKMLSTLKLGAVPECLNDNMCRLGLDLSQFKSESMLPFCHPFKRKCMEPLRTSIKVDVADESSPEEVKEHMKTALSMMIFGFRNEDHIDIVDSDDSSGGNVSMLQQEAATRGGRIGLGDTMDVDVIVKNLKTEDGLDTQALIKKFKKHLSVETDAEKLHLVRSGVLPSGFSMMITELGVMCEPRDLPPNGAKACGLTKSGHTCELECEEGWVGHSNVACDEEGRWSDDTVEGSEVPEDDVPVAPGGEAPAVFECREAVCPPMPFPDNCPRGKRGCMTWKSSECERGGLSGTQAVCEIEPAEGYQLADPSNNRYICKTNGRSKEGVWARPKEFQGKDVEVKEGTCDCSGAMDPSLGLVDKDSGVTQICGGMPSIVSGLVVDERPAGRVEVVCKQGYKVREENPLVCLPTGLFEGMAACEKISCKRADLVGQFDGVTDGSLCGGETTVNIGGTCKAECRAGQKIGSNSLKCSSTGEWQGSISCIQGTDGQGGGGGGGGSAGGHRVGAPSPPGVGASQGGPGGNAPARGPMYAVFLPFALLASLMAVRV
eukprot:TRINITY_DN19367_c0_g1_i1.p1 TRINITY_DN19367_c0_g1~~TRINITY_DN19367_c0_g1_i1.p1  ORF type:complete len:1261 (-),score=325.93 TRINITY_DN19367_c0_g1_i1:176-3958(-)